MTEDEFVLKANQIRGSVITHTNILERHLDEFIADYFSDSRERQIEMIEMLIAGLNYSTKVSLLISILKKIANTKVLHKEFEVFREDLKKVAKTRNRFAHDVYYPFLNESDRKKFAISLVDFSSNIQKPINYTEKQIIEIGNKTQTCINYILAIRKYIQGDAPDT